MVRYVFIERGTRGGEANGRLLHMVARLEGLLLDPVYTGKAMAGLIHAIRNGEFTPGQNVLFWHTGGAVALFAYRDVFEAYLGREKKHPRNR